MKVRSTLGVLMLTLVCHTAVGEQAIDPSNNTVASVKLPSEQTAWPMLPGENLKNLSVRFFPNDENLQRAFIEKTIKLNAKTIPNLTADVYFTSPRAILIPKPKTMRLGIHPIKPAVVDAPTLQLSYGFDNSNINDTKQKMRAELPASDTNVAQQWVQNNLWAPTQAFFSDLSIDHAKEKLFGNPPGTGGLSLLYEKVANYLAEQDPVRMLLWIVATSALLLGVYLPIRAKRTTVRSPKHDRRREEPVFSFAAPKADAPLPESTALTTELSPQAQADRLILAEAKNLVEQRKVDDAISHLQRAIRAKSRTSIVVWLYLLVLLKRTKRRNAFEQNAKELHKTFNVVAPTWRKNARSRSLESHKHIEKRITAQWPMGKLRPYLQKLVDDNRSGFRGGFSVSEIEEILLLIDVLDARNDADKTKS